MLIYRKRQKQTETDFCIIKDGNVLEVYLFEGRYNFTSMIYPTNGEMGIGLKAKDAAIGYK